MKIKITHKHTNKALRKKCVFNLSIPFLFGDHFPKSLQANVMISVLKQAMSTFLLLYLTPNLHGYYT